MERVLSIVHAPLPYERCPTQAALDLLGKPWCLAILTDVVYWRLDRFGELLAANPALPRRTLSVRLRELVAAGVLHKEGSTTATRYALTARGRDVVPIVHALMRFGMKHRPELVFRDRRARNLDDLLPERNAQVAASLPKIKAALTRRGQPPARRKKRAS